MGTSHLCLPVLKIKPYARPETVKPLVLKAFRFFLNGFSCFPVDNLNVVLRRASTELGNETLEILLSVLLLIVDLRINIRLILLEHVVDIGQELASHGHDRLLVALAPLQEVLELAPHRCALRLHRRSGAFADVAPEVLVALAGLGGSALPCRFVLRRAEAGPGAKRFRRIEGLQSAAPQLGEEQAGREGVDSRYGLEQFELPLPLLPDDPLQLPDALAELGIEVVDGRKHGPGRKQVAFLELPAQCEEHLLARVPVASKRRHPVEELFRLLSVQNAPHADLKCTPIFRHASIPAPQF